MTRTRIGLVAAGVILAAAPAAGQSLAAVTGSAAVAPRVAERDRLRAAVAPKIAADPVGSLAAAEAAQAIDRVLFGNESAEAATGLSLLAGVLEWTERWNAAAAAREEARTIWVQLHGATHWRVTDARLDAEHGRRLRTLTPSQRQKLRDADDEIRKALWAGQASAKRASAERALALRKEVLGGDDWMLAGALDWLGYALRDVRDLPAAKRAYEEALVLYRRTYGDDHPYTARTLGNLGGVFRDLGDIPAARKCHEEAVAVFRRAHGDDHPDTARSLSNLGLALLALRDLPAARTAFEESVAVRRRVLPPDHPDTARSLYNLGIALADLGDVLAAKRAYEEALAIRRKALPAAHLDTAQSLTRLGNVLYQLGNLPDARRHYEEALVILRKLHPPDHPDIATAWRNLGLVLGRLGELAAARRHFEEALAIRRKAFGPHHPSTATTLNDLGTVLSELGDLPGARRACEEALAIRKKALPEGHPDIAFSLTAVGMVLRHLGDLAAARKSYEEAVAIFRKARPPDQRALATSLRNLGMVLSRLGDLPGARRACEEALAVCREALPPDHLDTAWSLNYLGDVLNDLGDRPAARKLFEEGLAIFRKVCPDGYLGTAGSLFGLGATLHALGDLPAARGYYEAAAAIDRRHLNEAAIAQGEQVQLEAAARLWVTLDRLLSVTVGEPSVYPAVLGWKGAVTARQHFAAATRDLSDPDTRTKLDELRRLSAALLAAGVERDEGNRPSGLTGLHDLVARYDKLQRELAERSPAFKATGRVPTPAEVRAALSPGTVLLDLLEYVHRSPPADGGGKWVTESRLVAFVLRRDKEVVVRVDLGPAAPVAEAVRRWRERYGTDRRPVPDGKSDPGAELRSLVWDKLAAHLGGAKVVLVSPDGPLTGLPFAALPGDKPGSYLIEDGYAFATAPVPQLLPQLLAPPGKPADPSLLAVGDVDYGRPVGLAGPYRPLAGTRPELDVVRDLFARAHPGAAVTADLDRERATKRAFVEAAPRYRFLHVATHGFFANESVRSALDPDIRTRAGWVGHELDRAVTESLPGLLSGLVFAGANTEPVAGLLTALETGDLDLRGVELAVLSACHTGEGKVAGGEGVLGLQRAFQVAGARTVVASLWAVPDAETQRLMVRFYGRLWGRNDPVSKVEALRQAQLAALRGEAVAPSLPLAAVAGGPALVGTGDRGVRRPAGGPVDPRHPYYWAAFVLSGDWR